jgi:hypothetical protein
MPGSRTDSQPPKPAAGDKDSSADRVARLMAQLGSATFEEREAASSALASIGVPALGALREAAANHPDAEVRRRAAEVVSQLENSLEALAFDYRALGLPLPPADAPLVWTGDSLDFLLRPGTKETPPLLLDLAGRFTHFALPPIFDPQGRLTRFDSPPIAVIDPRLLGDDAFKVLPAAVSLSVSEGVPMAIFCKLRGWSRFAEALFQRSVDANPGTPPRLVFAALAWNHSLLELRNPDSNWAPLCKRMKALLAVNKDLRTEANRKLLASLEAALVPSKAPPGSIAAMIDDLIEAKGSIGRCWRMGDDRIDDPRIVRLLERGFEAVPDLFEHLEDDRLTRHFKDDGNMFLPQRLCFVDELVGDLLSRLSAGALSADCTKEEALAWWGQARAEGEEAYALAHVLDGNRVERAAWDGDGRFNRSLLLMIARKYPRHLPRLFQRVLDDLLPEIPPFAEAIRKSALPRQTKVELLASAASPKRPFPSPEALGELKHLDHARFMELLVSNLETLLEPGAEREDPGSRDAFPFLGLVTEPEEWRALAKAARRADVGIRMEYLHRVSRLKKDVQDNEALAFLACFLDDATVRDLHADRYRYRGTPAAFTIPRLEVRNLAAMRIADVLDLPLEVDASWTPEQWADFRAQVRKALPR